MKKNLFLTLALAASMVALVSCKKDPVAPDATLEIQNAPTTVPYTAGTATFDVVSNSSWEVSNDDLWVTSVTPDKGEGDKTVTIRFAENSQDNERTATFKVKAGAVEKSFTISQDGTKTVPTLTVSPEEGTFRSSGEEVTFTVTTNLTGWTATVTGTGFSKKSESGNTIVVAAAANDTESSRTGALTFSHADLTSDVVVNLTQAAPAPMLTLTEVVTAVYDEDGSFMLQMATGTSLTSQGIYIDGISTISDPFKLAAGNYTIKQDISAAGDLLAGSIDSSISGSFGYDEMTAEGSFVTAGLKLITSGTMTVAADGGITIKMEGTYYESGQPTSMNYKFNGTIDWMTYMDYFRTPSEIDSWTVEPSTKWNGVAVDAQDMTTAASWTANLNKHYDVGNRGWSGFKYDAFDYNATGNELQPVLITNYVPLEGGGKEMIIITGITIESGITLYAGGTPYTGDIVQFLGISNTTTTHFATFNQGYYFNSADLSTQDKFEFAGDTEEYDFKQGAGTKAYDVCVFNAFIVDGNYMGHIGNSLANITLTKQATPGYAYAPSYSRGMSALEKNMKRPIFMQKAPVLGQMQEIKYLNVEKIVRN